MLQFNMSGWSISRRITTIASMLMGGLIVIAALGQFATLRFSGLFQSYQDATVQADLATLLAEDLFEAEIAEMRYRSTPSQAVVDIFNDNLAEVQAEGTELHALITDQDDLAAELDSLMRSIDGYAAEFLKVVAFRADRDSLVNTIFTDGPEIRKSISAMETLVMFGGSALVKSTLAQAYAEFNLSRIFSERFLLTNAQSEFDQANKHMSAAIDAMTRAANEINGDDRKQAAQDVVDSLRTYWGVIISTRNLIFERNAVRENLTETAHELNAAIEHITEVSATQRDALGASASTTKWIVSVLLVLASAGTALAGWIVANRIGQSTVKAVESSISSMQALSSGDLEVEINGTEDENEFGDIARSLVVFRDSANERIALEETQREQEAINRQRQSEERQRARDAEAEQKRLAEEKQQAMIVELATSIGMVVDAGAKGDFSKRIEAQFDAPEIAEMASSINRLVGNVDVGLGEATRVIGLLSNGDLSARMNGDFHGAFATLRDDVNLTFETLCGLVFQLSKQCDQVGSSADAMAHQANELAKRAEQQAASLEETSAAVEEISRAATTNAEASAEAARTADDASTRVESAGGVVSAAVQAMGGIKESSSRISEIVSVIDGIAFQTNLLALNASVEAARAGSAGKGFAVVASEVRELAQRSGGASKNIRELIDEGASQVDSGVGLVEQAGQRLEEIMEGVAAMAESMKSLTSTAQEQASSITEVSSAVSQLDTITQKNAVLAEQGRNASNEMGEKSKAMIDLVSWFELAGKTAEQSDKVA